MLSFPFLWSRICIDSDLPPKVIQALLQRSGSHPLNLTVPVRHAEASRLNRRSNALEASAHMSRIRKLTIYEDSGETDLIHLLKIFSKPAPNLTHLLLFVYGEYSPISVPDWFGSGFPNLRKLEVRGVIAWQEAIGTNLTHIVIKSSLDPPQLIRCLQYSPSLKVLEILGVDRLNKSPRRVTLPSGAHLTIKDSDPCSNIVGIFSLPSDGYLQIDAPSLRGWDRAFTFLYWALPPTLDHLQNLDGVTRLHVKTRFDTPGTLAALEVKCFKRDLTVLDVNIELSISANSRDESDSPAMFFLDNFDGMKLSEVEELRMEGFFGPLEPYAEELVGLLAGMPGLVWVFTDHNQEKLCSALDLLGRRATVVMVVDR